MINIIKEKRKEISLFILFSLVIYLSQWFWRISQESILVTIVVSSIAFFITFDLAGFIKSNKRYMVYFFLIILGVHLTITSFNTDIFKQNGTERSVFEQRKHLDYGVNKLFINNGYNSFLKIQRNFFTNLDFNQYFFGGEPRFRSYATDFSKFPFLFLPFFLYGIFLIVKNIKRHIIFLSTTLLILLCATFTELHSMMGMYTLFPIITSLILLGFYSFLSYSTNLLRRKNG